MKTLKKIISGGQTGADRAALDTAIKLGISYGGSIPAGRRTECGPLDQQYQMIELESTSYAHRTEQNVRDSDGTVLLSHGALSGGSLLTCELAKQYDKPLLHLDLNICPNEDAARSLRSFITEHGIETLNVAGPRASDDPAIYDAVTYVLHALFRSRCKR